ncbi:hypothetical protein Tco_0026606 [Tanacetum coccineum]
MVAYLKKPTGSEGFQEIVDFLNDSYIRYALTKNSTIYVSLIEKFWQTATVRTVDNGEQEITATVDGKEFTITETSEPIPNVPDEAVYEEWDDRVERATTTAASLDAEQASDNINRTQSSAMPMCPFHRELVECVNTLGSDEGSMQLQELMALCTKLSYRVLALETDLRQTKKVYGAAYTKLIMKVYISTAEESDSTTGVSMPVSTAGMVQEVNISFPSPVVVKDKGKGIMTESKDEQTKRTKIQLEQERLSHEAAVRLQEELDEEERQRMARVHEAA